MAGSKVNEYGIADVNLTALMASVDAQRIGYFAADLTEYTTTTVPKVASGSKLDVNGALYKFDSDETITGSPSDGNVWIKVIPAGSSITAVFTNTEPVWSSSKHGWYGESGSENHRYIASMIKDGSEYRNKVIYNTGREITTMDFQTLFSDEESTTINAAATHDVVFTFDWDVEAVIALNITPKYNDALGAASDADGLMLKDVAISDDTVTITLKNTDTANHVFDFGVMCTASKKRV